MSLLLTSVALLSACGGGDGSGGGGTPIEDFFTISAAPDGSGTLGSYYMQTVTSQWRDAAASFRTGNARFKYQSGTVTLPGGGTAFSNPLFSSRVDYAHAVGLSGLGQVIAIVDAGFRQTHDAFKNKTNTTTGGPGVDDHGTMVASIAAGDSAKMVGVAPDADLIFSDWGDDSTADLTAAANAARTRKAVAQNNSWGFDTLFANTSDYNTMFVNDAQGAAWLAALRNYALGTGTWDGGVVVFAVDNVDNGKSGLMDGLPSLSQQSDLRWGWLAVGNAVPTFDDNGVTAGTLISSPCYESAAWCLVADGYWTAATDTSNTSYGSGTGSSFAAPQVSGALALLAEAFPNLTPHQLRARILASADNSFTGFVSAGTTDVIEGTGVWNHSYSLEFGHGFLDIRAALLPIGPTTLSTVDGGKIATEDFAFSTGGAMGDAVTRSLAGADVSMTDALEGGFDVAAKDFVATADPTGLAETLAARTYAKDYGKIRTAPVNPLADTFRDHPGQTLAVSTVDGRTRAVVLLGGSETYGVSVSRSLTEGDLSVDVGIKLARDGGALMGFSDAGGGGADMASVTLGLSHDLGSGGFFSVTSEFGIADMATPAAMSAVDTADFNSFSVQFGSRSVFAAGDKLTVGVSMPIAVTQGSADLIVPVTFGDGSPEARSVSVDLAPTERQIDLTFGYQMPVGERSELMLSFVHAENYGNQVGVSDQAAVIGMKWAF